VLKKQASTIASILVHLAGVAERLCARLQSEIRGFDSLPPLIGKNMAKKRKPTERKFLREAQRFSQAIGRPLLRKPKQNLSNHVQTKVSNGLVQDVQWYNHRRLVHTRVERVNVHGNPVYQNKFARRPSHIRYEVRHFHLDGSVDITVGTSKKRMTPDENGKIVLREQDLKVVSILAHPTKNGWEFGEPGPAPFGDPIAVIFKTE
jgi:hypothetical protein